MPLVPNFLEPVQGQPFEPNFIPPPELQQYMGQQEQMFLAPHSTQLEGDNAPVYDPLQLPPDTLPTCPVCGQTFKRKQERNRHLRSYLPHCIYCPFPGCAWRCDRHDNLRNHWEKNHADYGQAPQKRGCEIYNPDAFVKSVSRGEMSIEQAAESALSEVIRRAFEEDKQDLWAENWWGRRGSTTLQLESLNTEGAISTPTHFFWA